MTPAEPKSGLGRLSQETLIPLGVAITFFFAATGAAVWLNSQLQNIQFEIRSLRGDLDDLRKSVEKNGEDAVSYKTLNAWIALNRAKGMDLADLPPH